MKFEDLNLEPSLMEGLSAMNFQEMTPVQEASIPKILEGKDIIACAQTGTGKTAAYLLPLLNKLMTDEHSADAVSAIVMAPTRELAQQIDQQLEGFSYFLSVSSVAVYGGNDASVWDQQKKALQMGADFVIATPGRLISHISLDNVDFSKVKYFVLDEADRMLDMGFYDDIITIVNKLPKERQTIMFSATMPPKIQKLAKTILNNPEMVNIAISKPAEGIKQEAYVCYETQKFELLSTVLKEDETRKTIVFSSSKLKVKEIARQLKRRGLSVVEMHSDLEQADRDAALLDFKSGKATVLIATDIVSRGIDIDDIETVINYDVPHDVEDYIHRIGRTARANRTGRGVTFISEEDQEKFGKVEQFLEKTIDKLPLPESLGEGPAYEPSVRRGNNRGQYDRRNGNRQGGNRGDRNGHRNNRDNNNRDNNGGDNNGERRNFRDRRDGNRDNNRYRQRNNQSDGQPNDAQMVDENGQPIVNQNVESQNQEGQNSQDNQGRQQRNYQQDGQNGRRYNGQNGQNGQNGRGRRYGNRRYDNRREEGEQNAENAESQVDNSQENVQSGNENRRPYRQNRQNNRYNNRGENRGENHGENRGENRGEYRGENRGERNENRDENRGEGVTEQSQNRNRYRNRRRYDNNNNGENGAAQGGRFWQKDGQNRDENHSNRYQGQSRRQQGENKKPTETKSEVAPKKEEKQSLFQKIKSFFGK